jgi:hypothetical protein
MLDTSTMNEVDKLAARYQPPIRKITSDDYEGVFNLPDADETLDNHRNAPRPDPACLYGLIGEIALAGSENTEANPYAIAANMLSYMACGIGRGPFMPVGNTWHHPRLFMLHIGRSGRGRKGDAVSLVMRIDKALRTLNAYAAPQVHRGGLSSREGMVFLIHDGFTEGKNEIEAIHDKRLLIVESEFANVLQQGKRDGNTLSPALRDCWDGGSMKPATKSNRLSATDPHVGMIAAITPSELLSVQASRELTNGFANRFTPFWAERIKEIPFPQATAQPEVDQFAVRVLEVFQHCGSERYAERDNMRVSLTPDAQKLYAELYRGELNDNSAGERITSLLERRAPMLLRLAMVFALCDLKTEVAVEHVKAARAWVRYSVESVKFVFASAADEVAVEETNDTARKIIAYLKDKTKATRKELTSGCFQGHTSKSRIDAALDELLSANPPRVKVESIPRPKGSPGSATKIYQLTGANSANCANSEDSYGFKDEIAERELSEPCELSPVDKTTVRTVSTVRNPENQAQIVAGADNSQSSHSSLTDSENPVDEEAF